MLTIRPATTDDVPVIFTFIRELAAYERVPEAVQASEADLLRDGWGLAADASTPLSPPQPARFTALMAELDGTPVGFALYFTSYSTWVGHHGIRLEDLYVSPAARGRGVGKALLARLAQIAIAEGCSRLEWDVLHWNEPAINFYHRMGALMQKSWHTMRVAGEPLHRLAAHGPEDEMP